MTGVTYPGVYQRFLDGINVLNLDLVWVLQTGCLAEVNFHHRLLAATMVPLLILMIIGGAYAVTIRGHLSLDNLRAAMTFDGINQKYLSLVLLLTFVVYSSVSSILFQAFACDELDNGNVYLRTDYRIKCDSSTHRTLQVYASCMMLVYTAGIPVLYGALLFHCRLVLTDVELRGETLMATSISSLWSLYKPRCFYYELVECFRRVLLAGVVVFIYPDTVAQIAIALMFSACFMVLCETLAPYDSVWDAWVSRLGNGLIFCSMYLALLLKVEVSDEDDATQKVYEALLVGTHVIMVVIALAGAVIASCNWCHRQPW